MVDAGRFTCVPPVFFQALQFTYQRLKTAFSVEIGKDAAQLLLARRRRSADFAQWPANCDGAGRGALWGKPWWIELAKT
ncbi:MAG: hypothetical protein ACREE6_10125 [Limisphaerales bacterium]